MKLKDLSLSDLAALKQELIIVVEYWERKNSTLLMVQSKQKLDKVKLEINRRINKIEF